ncbi:hypothetical protein Pcinc_036809 [Petrolisthes cinctipes]|uniref:Uncharacterized protein n=1 Tax=Petrolisthes cinctipes TaxID=88211 RepID=A0AAE1BUA6_PETCI|nr:hypothetical protein Pcinc_036809 [Petrolisthes cinctipes]
MCLLAWGSELVSEVETRDQSTSTEAEETPSEDLSLPLSIDSGLDLSSDYKKARVSEGRVWLAQLSCAAGNPDCPAALHLSSLLDWVAALPALPHHAPSTPVSPTLATPSRDRMGVEEIGCSMGRDLMVLAARLQESLADPPTQETVLLDTISKLRVLERSLSGLQERVASLTEENRELHETVANLSEAQETRTEASGTESELVHRKTPSIHSDLSDAELSDSPEHIQSRGGKLGSALDATTSFQESGIFDTSCDLVHSTTQTDLRDLELRKSEYDLHESECDLKQAEGDLQSAVARLAAIRSAVQDRDLRHLRIQDLQESEEYLKAALDGSQISLTKVEYDTLVDTERRLRQEMENLKCEKQELECEKQELELQCSSLRHQAATQKGTDAEEALKGEIRVLRQRLAMTERAHREIFEEKCELEEEENDSRLMVQRLESQMEAAREMENLLSASLSQEQEISRELHRRVRDLQILEKEYRGRLERMCSLRAKAEEKAISLVKDKDTLTQQLIFAVYGLLLVDNWRLTVPQHALVPYIGKKLKVIDGCDTTTVKKNHQNIMEFDESVTDTYTKEIEPQNMMEFESCEKNVSECVCVRVSCDASVQTCLSDSAECDSPVRGNIKEKQDQATMTPKCVSLSEREEYYLEQIENLQKEKMNLRKGHDNERRDSLQHHTDLEGELLEVRSQLEEAERDKCRLLFRLEEIQDEKETIKRNLLQRIEEIKGDMGRYNDIFELEKKSLQKAHNSQLHEAEKERSRLDERVRQLEFQISTFKQELEIVGVAVANDLVEMDAEMESVLSQSTKSTIKHGASDGELVNKIRELVKSETSLRQRIYDLEKKECAYHETIREADKIMSSHVTSYKQRIEDLETAAGQQDSKIKQLEASEERLRAALRSTSRTSDGERISDLLDRLIQTENSELKLKESVWNLEKNEKELQIKLMEGEKANQSLRGELRDQEELVHRLMSLETENNALSAELSQAKDSARKVSELQQNESFLRGRVEELEVTENMLRETLHQADLILTQRERKLRDQVSSLKEELQSCRSQLEAGTLREHCAREAESVFKKQLEDLKTRLAESEKELMESSSETISHETQHRSEVTKLRNHLKLCNSQLLELDRLNCELRERVVEAEREGQRYASELEELSRRHEQDLLAFNLQVCSRDSHVEDLENQVEQLSQSRATGELDALAATPLPALHAALRALTTAVKNCDTCSATQSATLVDVSGQLGTLTELLEGQCNTLDTTTSDAEEDVSETAENLATGATTTHPSWPAREGVQDASSGDDDNDSSNSADKLNTNALRRRSKRRLNKGMERRQANVVAASSTILEELEEKVKEMEEVLGVKEEELRQKEEELRLRSELVGVKEQELRLADAEASELNSQLQARDAALIEKSKEVEDLNSALASLRQQLVITLEEAERTRLSIHANYQKNFEALKRKAEQITEQVEWLSRRGQLKDSIISTLAMQIRAILRSGNMGVIVNQIRSLSKADKANRQQLTDANTTPAVPDFDVESVCSLLSQPGEMASLPQSSTLEPPSHMILQSSTSLAPSTTKPGHISPLASRVCSMVHHKKSRIPRFLTPPTTPSPIPNPKPTTLALKPRPASLKLIKPPVQTIKLIPPKTDGTSTPTHQPQRVEPAPQSVQTKLAPVVRQDAKPAPSKATSNLMPVMSSSTPAKATGRKDTTRPEVPTRVLTDARKVKRMITGVAPLDAAVNCSAAPEWKESSPAPQANSTCVPRPQNLHITRRVGVDGVVIAWDPLEHDCVAGFQVLLGGRVVQHVRSPHRTKALVTSLPLAGSITVGLVAVASDGRCSTPALVTQDRSRNYPGRTVAQKPLRRAVPTAL